MQIHSGEGSYDNGNEVKVMIVVVTEVDSDGYDGDNNGGSDGYGGGYNGGYNGGSVVTAVGSDGYGGR